MRLEIMQSVSRKCICEIVAMPTDVGRSHYKVTLCCNEYQASDEVDHLCISAHP